MDRLGLSYDDIKSWNPRLIYVAAIFEPTSRMHLGEFSLHSESRMRLHQASNSGFGPTGEWSERPSYDGMAQARV